MLPDRANGSFQVRRGIVRQNLIDDVLRLLHIDWLERGHSAQTLGEWLWGMHWFPHLTHRNEILALARSLPTEWQTGKLCDPQILLQFPHVGPEPDIVFHVDEEPHWAQGRQYARIVGVPLTQWRRENGGLLVNVEGEPVAVELDPGDAVVLDTDLEHSGGVNRTGSPRYCIYFRWLQDA